jgi:hypothetical protein
MKTPYFCMPYLLLLCLLGACGGSFDRLDRISEYDPIYLEKNSLKNSVYFSTNPVDLQDVGKIYTKGNLLFINELYKGVHIFDNQNPATPRKLGFIYIAGNVDIAIKGNTLYADNTTDLVTLDLTNLPTEVSLVNRKENVFQEMNLTPDGIAFQNLFKDKVVMGWRKRKN